MAIGAWFTLLLLSSIQAILANDLIQRYTVHSDYAVKAPPPSEKAVECLTQMTTQLLKCRNESLKNWNVHDYSPLGDVCCAQWDLLECDLDDVAKVG